MAADAFAAAIGKGIALRSPSAREALRHGVVFGAIAAAMPAVGWLLGSLMGDAVAEWDHWVAFALLAGLGVTMAVKSLQQEEGADAGPSREGLVVLAVAGFATSIDAFAAGVSLAFIDAAIVDVSIAIGVATFAAVTVGVLLGRHLGQAMGRAAEFVGGLILVGIGLSILYQHLSAAGPS